MNTLVAGGARYISSVMVGRRWQGHTTDATACLLYFNAAGASEKYGEDHHPETYPIPNVLKVALGAAPHVSIFGDAPDGTFICDYVHV
jgi:UDP-glucose 4-epimerase